MAKGLVRREQRRADLLAGLRPDSAEAEGENEFAVAGGQVNFRSQGDVSVFRQVVLPGHLEMLRQVLPTVGYAGKSDGTLYPGYGAAEGKRERIARGEKHGPSLVIADPAGIAVSHIAQVRGQKGIEAVVAETSLEREKSNFLQHHVSPGIGQHFFFDPITALDAGIGQLVDRHPRLDRNVFKCTMALFLGKKLMAVSDNQAEVAGAGLIHAGKIDFVENAVTQGEPDAAVEVERGADSGLGTRSPARFDTGPARRITNFVTHRGWTSPSSSLPEVANLRWKFHQGAGNSHLRSQKPGCRDSNVPSTRKHIALSAWKIMWSHQKFIFL